MVTPAIVVLDEALDLGFEITGQIIVLEQNAVLERLVPALDHETLTRLTLQGLSARRVNALRPDQRAFCNVGHNIRPNVTTLEAS
jgi:hypothetical protein